MVSAPSVSDLERNLSLSAGMKWTDLRRRTLEEERWRQERCGGCSKRFVACFKNSVVDMVVCSDQVATIMVVSILIVFSRTN